MPTLCAQIGLRVQAQRESLLAMQGLQVPNQPARGRRHGTWAPVIDSMVFDNLPDDAIEDEHRGARADAPFGRAVESQA